MAFASINPQDSLCQGDIFDVVADGASSMWGVILTADCDLAQSKFGDHLTYAPIISASAYISQVWAPARLQELVGKAAARSIEGIWRLETARDPEVLKLSPAELVAWVGDRGAAGICDALASTGQKISSELQRDLSVIETARRPAPDPLHSLQRCWSESGLKENQAQGVIRSALTQLRSEYFYFPTLSGVDGIGYVVLLRDIRAVHISHVFRSETDRKLSDVKGASLVRIGRFNDNLKYAIVQQFAYLFSRIGLEAEFESERDGSIDLLLEMIPTKAVVGG